MKLPRIPLRFDRGFAFWGALIVLVSGLGIGLINENVYAAQKLKELDIQSRILAESVTAPLMFSDPAAARENATALAENPEVDAVGLYDQAGNLVGAFARPSDTNPLPVHPQAQPPVYRGDFLDVVRPVARDTQRYGAVYIRLRRDPLLVRLGRYAPFALLMMMAVLVLTVAGAAQGALKHANATLAQRAGDLSEANKRLAEEIDHRKQTEEALLQSQKMEAIGQLTGGVAHDFNNLLMVIVGGLRLMEKHTDPERQRKTIEAMQQAVERGAGLTRQLLAFARRQTVKLETVSIEERLNCKRALLERSLRGDILLDIAIPGGLPLVTTDPGQLELAVLNLCVNARDAMPKGGVITISAQLAARGDKPMIEITVRDTGAGIPQEIIGRIFEPYFTTKPVGQGTGLGLSQVYGFAKQSGGDVRVENSAGAGATIVLSLPVSEEAQAVPSPAPVRSETDETPQRILVVEDDDSVADTVCSMLEELGHKPRRATSAKEALQILHDNAFDLVFSDIVMSGGKSGLDLARELEVLAPRLPVLLTTGYSGREEIAADRPVLRKPYQLQDLREAIAALIGRQVSA